MNLSALLRSTGLVAFYCTALAFLSFFVLSPDGTASIAVFILVALMSFVLRPIYDTHVKSLGYLFLGMLSYWSFGWTFVSSSPSPEFQVPVLFGFSAIGAIIALVTYSDGRLSGYSFAGGAMVLAFLAQKDIWSVSAAVIVFISAAVIVQFISRISSPEEFMKKTAIASVISGVLLVAAMLSKNLAGAVLGVYSVPGAAQLAIGSVEAVAASLAFMFLALKSFDLVLARIRLRRFIEGDRVLFGSTEEQPTLPKKGKQAFKRANKS